MLDHFSLCLLYHRKDHRLKGRLIGLFLIEMLQDALLELDAAGKEIAHLPLVERRQELLKRYQQFDGQDQFLLSNSPVSATILGRYADSMLDLTIPLFQRSATCLFPDSVHAVEEAVGGKRMLRSRRRLQEGGIQIITEATTVAASSTAAVETPIAKPGPVDGKVEVSEEVTPKAKPASKSSESTPIVETPLVIPGPVDGKGGQEASEVTSEAAPVSTSSNSTPVADTPIVKPELVDSTPVDGKGEQEVIEVTSEAAPASKSSDSAQVVETSIVIPGPVDSTPVDGKEHIEVIEVTSEAAPVSDTSDSPVSETSDSAQVAEPKIAIPGPVDSTPVDVKEEIEVSEVTSEAMPVSKPSDSTQVEETPIVIPGPADSTPVKGKEEIEVIEVTPEAAPVPELSDSTQVVETPIVIPGPVDGKEDIEVSEVTSEVAPAIASSDSTQVVETPIVIPGPVDDKEDTEVSEVTGDVATIETMTNSSIIPVAEAVNNVADEKRAQTPNEDKACQKVPFYQKDMLAEINGGEAFSVDIAGSRDSFLMACFRTCTSGNCYKAMEGLDSVKVSVGNLEIEVDGMLVTSSREIDTCHFLEGESNGLLWKTKHDKFRIKFRVKEEGGTLMLYSVIAL